MGANPMHKSLKQKQNKRFLIAVLFFIFSILLVNAAFAIGLIESSGLEAEEEAQAIPDKIEHNSNTDWRSGTYGKRASKPVDPDEIRPFGSHLFQGGFSGVRADGLNSTYKIMPGDQVTLRLWGAVEVDRIMPVDSHGNVFIPSVGPINVKGLPYNQLDSKVRSAVKSIYPENVNVYTNLQGVQPVAVFVTGFANNPGRYAGTPNDSVLYFIDQAGGIDADLGSYRYIRVLRKGKAIANIDLYDFLLHGDLPRPQFRDGDTIIIDSRGPSVTVTGEVPRSHRYELKQNELTGENLLELTQVQSNVSHILQRGGRPDGPISVYHDLKEFPKVKLVDGDELLYSADQRDETIVVQLEGSFYGPSRHVLTKDARLHELLDIISVPPKLTDINSISIRRESIAERQKRTIQDSLMRLETTYLSASSSSADESKIRVQEAEMIRSFVQRASNIEPNGRLVVAENQKIQDVRLEDGDVITIPEKADSILVSGEVLMTQSIVFNKSMGAMDYIDRAGGLTDRANDDKILVVRLSGDVRDAGDVNLRAGDEILVLPKAPTKNLQLATSLTQILYQIAIATSVAMDL